MTRFQFRGWTILSLINAFLAIVFNKLLIRIDYEDDRTEAIIKTEYKLKNRLDYPKEK